MKKVKVVLFSFTFLFIAYYVITNIARVPTYSVKTSGKLYVVNKLGTSISVIDLYLGKEIKNIPIKKGYNEATTTFDHKKVVITNYGTQKKNGKNVLVIDTKTNKIVENISLNKSEKPHGIKAFPNSNKVALVTNESNELLIINLDKNTIEKKIPTLQYLSHLLVLHPNKPIAYVTNYNSGSISIIDIDQNKVIKTIKIKKGVMGINITPNGKEIWVSNSIQNSVTVIKTDSFNISQKLVTGNKPLRLHFSIDGNFCLVTNSKDGTISIFDTHSKKLFKTIQIRGKKGYLQRTLYHTPTPINIVMHPNGLYAYIANSNANEIQVLDMKNFSLVSTIRTGKRPYGLTFAK